MRDDIRSDAEKDPDELEREVDQQRAYVSETLSALERRFSPGQIFDQVLSYTRDNSGDFSRNLVNTVKNNPVPTLLTATGLLWMMAGQNRSSMQDPDFNDEYMSRASYGVDPAYEAGGGSKMGKLKDKAGHMREGAGQSIGKAKERLHHMSDSAHSQADRTRQHLHDARDSMRQQAQRASEGFSRMLDEQPLALGAMGIALGALIGASLPRTQRENELMGEKRDQLAQQASQMAQQGYEKARDVGTRVAENAKQEAEQEAKKDTQSASQPPSTGTSTGVGSYNQPH